MSKGKKKQAKKSALKDLPGRTVRASEQNKVKGGMMMMDVTTEDPSSGGSTSNGDFIGGAVAGVGRGFTNLGRAISGIFN